VTRVMNTSIRSVVRGYWQGVKKLGRAYTLSVAGELDSKSSVLNTETMDEGRRRAETIDEGRRRAETIDEGGKRAETIDEGGKCVGTIDEGRRGVETTNEGERHAEGINEGGFAFPVFTERPFIRPLSRRGQLHTMIRYVQMNPQRLATKRMKPGYFRVQKDIKIGGRKYDGVGNVALLMAEQFDTVHVRSVMVKAAEQGDSESLRNYMNGCVLAARKGIVMVSPFISPHEKRVMQVLLQEQHPFILLTNNGFRDYYKPADALFDACAAGRMLILSPWSYDEGKRHISRSECVALNAMAEEICKCLNGTGKMDEVR